MIRKRKIAAKGAGKTASNTPEDKQTGGIVKRTIRPAMPEEPEVPDFPGELGAAIAKVAKSGDYGNPFIKASSKRIDIIKQRTGILSVDLCLGGGLVTSRAHMFIGEKSSGKSTLALQSIASIQKDNPDAIAAWVDVEGSMDKVWAKKLGVDLERLLIIEPESGEHAIDLAEMALRSKEVSIVVMDSIAMLVPMKEIEESVSQETMALQARVVGKYIRKTNNAIIKERSRGHRPILIQINQYRMKVGMTFGDPRVAPGGKSLEFSTTQQLETKNKEHIEKDSDGNSIVNYNEHSIKVTKNKSGGPMKEAVYKLIRLKDYDDLPEGWVDQARSIYRFGIQSGIVNGPQQSFEIDMVDRKFRGARDFNKWAIENPKGYAAVQQAIIDYFKKKWDL